MPLVINGGHAPDHWAEQQRHTRASGSASTSAAASQPLKIALVNNMPDAALEDTEAQFFSLIESAASDLPVDIPPHFAELGRDCLFVRSRQWEDTSHLRRVKETIPIALKVIKELIEELVPRGGRRVLLARDFQADVDCFLTVRNEQIDPLIGQEWDSEPQATEDRKERLHASAS